LTKENLQTELTKITINKESREEQLKGYEEIRNLLGTKGASEKAGALMVNYLKQ